MGEGGGRRKKGRDRFSVLRQFFGYTRGTVSRETSAIYIYTGRIDFDGTIPLCTLIKSVLPFGAADAEISIRADRKVSGVFRNRMDDDFGAGICLLFRCEAIVGVGVYIIGCLLK